MMNLRSVSEAEYRCPLCGIECSVSEFKGSMKEVICGKCEGRFEAK